MINDQVFVEFKIFESTKTKIIIVLFFDQRIQWWTGILECIYLLIVTWAYTFFEKMDQQFYEGDSLFPKILFVFESLERS